jgi:uncharacterized protein
MIQNPLISEELNWENSDRSLLTAIESCDLDLIQRLILDGHDVNQIYFIDQLTPLELATELNEIEIARTLIEAGANPNGGCTSIPLDIASSDGLVEIASLLIKAGADVNALLEGEDSILIGASAHGHLDIVKMLIEAGANPNMSSISGDFPLLSALINGYETIVEYLYTLTNAELVETAEQQALEYLRNK